ncbi:MAG: hypothetical protein RSD99_04280, partial [Janthinobacterium sp.]
MSSKMRNNRSDKSGVAGQAGPKQQGGSIAVTVHEQDSGGMVVNAAVSLYRGLDADCHNFNPATWVADPAMLVGVRWTDGNGCTVFSDLTTGSYVGLYGNFPTTAPQCVTVQAGCSAVLCFKPHLNPQVALAFETPDCHPSDCQFGRVGDRAVATVSFDGDQSADGRDQVQVLAAAPWVPMRGTPNAFSTQVRRAGMHRFMAQMMLSQRPELRSALPVPEGLSPNAMLALDAEYETEERQPQPISGNVGVSLTRTETEPTEDLPL